MDLVPAQEIMRKIRFLSAEKLVTIRRWTIRDISVTFIASPDWSPRPRCAAIPGMTTPSFFPCAAAEKNGVRAMRTSASRFLRSAAATDSRSFLWRQTPVSFLECSPRGLLALWRREDRAPGVVVRAAALHQAVCVLRRQAVSRYAGESGCRGIEPRLAHGQRTRQALHARATAACSGAAA